MADPQAKLDAAMATIGTLQAKLDAIHQQRADQDAAHQKQLADHSARHAKEIAGMKERHAKELEARDKAHTAALAAALAETPEARAHREKLAEITKSHQDQVRAATLEFRARTAAAPAKD